ncbi:hypothetical protein [Ochrobactrum chromiisoli]|uniref:Uncharacterized protein n=1 Tax=Ochrobactrum chromiisoli TaxID=2993941 RepID=A0ABT3QUG0_9HYPH|nr:hypothetical protein [Ochrobactrum chromiisoli]MCX2699228.1 hypothetical protein [Ochrobactrum chromiisoli]
MDWFPIIAGIFKAIVLVVAMFFAIKWHYNKDKEEKEKKMGENKESNRP